MHGISAWGLALYFSFIWRRRILLPNSILHVTKYRPTHFVHLSDCHLTLNWKLTMVWMHSTSFRMMEIGNSQIGTGFELETAWANGWVAVLGVTLWQKFQLAPGSYLQMRLLWNSHAHTLNQILLKCWAKAYESYISHSLHNMGI